MPKSGLGYLFPGLRGSGVGLPMLLRDQRSSICPKTKLTPFPLPSPASPWRRASPSLQLRISGRGHRSGSRALALPLNHLCYLWQITDFAGPQFPQLSLEMAAQPCHPRRASVRSDGWGRGGEPHASVNVT